MKPTLSFRLRKKLAMMLINLSQRLPPFAARGSYSGFEASNELAGVDFPEAELEYQDYSGFLAFMEEFEFESAISGKVVLDFGCGYGGRTVRYAESAKSVVGIEIFSSMVKKAAAYAKCKSKNKNNIEFVLGEEKCLQCEDDIFDVIVSFDVLEHVAHPDIIMGELARVLKPGGFIVMIFTPYWGLFSHHLNYITLFPGIHYIFSPEVLVAAINELLHNDPRYAHLSTAAQPDPVLSYNGRKKVLPTLNGITKREYINLLRNLNLDVQYIRSTPLLEKYNKLGRLPAFLNSLIMKLPFLDELFSHNLVAILKK